jgi:Fe-S-cluster-containing dehydrogenase component
MHLLLRRPGGRSLPGRIPEIWFANRLAEGKLPLCAEMCSTKALLAGDGEIIAQIYKERVVKRGYGSGAWGWQTAYKEMPKSGLRFSGNVMLGEE